jgi:hypothetical protein
MAAKTQLAKAIAEREAQINAEAVVIAAELDTIVEALPAFKEQVQDIKDGLSAEAEVKAAWRRGEDTPEGALYVAKEKDERAAYDLASMTARKGTLEGRLHAPSTLLADKIAPAVQFVAPGVKVITTIAPLKVWRNDVPAGTTAVVLAVDPKVEQDPFRQTLSGTVRAYFIRSGLMRPLSVAKIEAAHRNGKPDCSMTVTSNQVGDEGGWVTVAGTGNSEGNQSDPNALVLDTLTIKVEGVIDGLPIIPKVNAKSGLVKTWTMAVFSGFTRPGMVTSARVIDVPDIDEGLAFVIKYGMSSIARGTHAKATEEMDGNERTLTVRQKVNLQGVDNNAFAEQMQEGAEGYVGGSFIELGVLTAVEVTPRVEGGVMAANRVVEVVTVFKSLIA